MRGSKYRIVEAKGDTPYVIMDGTFSMDDLDVILEEMTTLYYKEKDTSE